MTVFIPPAEIIVIPFRAEPPAEQRHVTVGELVRESVRATATPWRMIGLVKDVGAFWK